MTQVRAVLLRLLCCLGLLLPTPALAQQPRTLAAAIFACPWTDPPLRSEELAVAQLVWQNNVSRQYALVRPSGAYSGVWLRDSYWTLTAIGDTRLSARALQ